MIAIAGGRASGCCSAGCPPGIGEDLILDLRRAVFDHVQTMPVAFFTRTRTGALVSRLNNDVIGAQRAFSDTLSGVVSNVVALVLTLVVMLALSWQITLLALVLLPVFVIPARRMGRRLAGCSGGGQPQRRDGHPDDRALLGARARPWSSCSAAPSGSRRSSRARARRVRDIGVRTAMVQMVFITALTLVSALALALVYGLGGWFALRGTLDAGAVVTLALLITRLYAPLTGAGRRRVEVMSALVSFERVFEILDLKPLITEKPDARDVPDGPVSVEFDDVTLRLPVGGQGVAGVAGGGRRAGHPRRGRGDPRRHRSGPSRARWSPWSAPRGRASRRSPSCSPGSTTWTTGAVRLGGVDVRDLTLRLDLRRRSGMVTQDGHLFHESVRENLLLARPEATEDELWDALRRARLDDLVALPAGRARHGGGRAWLPAVRRRAAAADHRPAAAGPPAGGHPRRGDRASRLHLRGRGAGRPRRGAGRAHGHRDRPPAVDRPGGGPDPGGRGRPDRGAGHGTRTCWPPAAATPSSTDTQFADAVGGLCSSRLSLAGLVAADRVAIGAVTSARGGGVTANRVSSRARSAPPPGPWWASTTAATIARPSPVLGPPCRPAARTRLVSARVNRSKTRSTISGGIPGPLSVTVISARPSDADRPASTRVPAGVWVRALASRFATTWCSRYRSAGR